MRNSLVAWLEVEAGLPRHLWLSSGAKDGQVLEVGAIETVVAGQQAIGLVERVCSDQKIGRDAGARAATFPIGLPGSTGLESRLDDERAIFDSQFQQHLLGRRTGREEPGDLRPDNVAGHQLPFVSAGSKCLLRRNAKRGIESRKVEDDAAIDGGDHEDSLLHGARP